MRIEMDKDDYEKSVLPMLRIDKEFLEAYSSSSEFKRHLNQDTLAEEKLGRGWIFWRRGQVDVQQTSHTFISLVKQYPTWLTCVSGNFLLQFWAAKEMKGGHNYLSTSDQPFLVNHLGKAISEYRKKCIEMERDGAEVEQLGGVGRAYRNKQPESTPDLRLYSINEFPLRDHAALCGFRAYLALPLLDFHNQCYGVLEFFSPSHRHHFLKPVSTLYKILETAGLRPTTHSYNWNKRMNRFKDEVLREVMHTLQLAVTAVPHLALAQVWVPCEQCNDPSCMERAYYIHHERDVTFSSVREIKDYQGACELQNRQKGVDSLGESLSNVSICKNPLSHYAQRARFSLGFVIGLESRGKQYVIQFILQPEYREDSSMQLLFGIIQTKLKSFKKVVLCGKLLQEFTFPNPIEPEAIGMLKVMDSHMNIFSKSDFTKYLETDDLCCLQPFIKAYCENSNGSGRFRPRIKEDYEGDEDSKDIVYSKRIFLWVFHSPNERVGVKEKILDFMKELAPLLGDVEVSRVCCMIQFWSLTIDGGRRCLKTLDQPYAVSRLAKGVASFRKKCIKHHYLVGEEVKEDELGPVGRVFRSGHHECLYDLYSYSEEEFSMRNFALHCGFKRYFALPVFDGFDKHGCVGVLEFIGFVEHYSNALPNLIISALQAAKLYWHPTSMEEATVNNDAMAEIKIALDLISKIPQCHTADVWIPYGRCTSGNSRRMKWLNPIEKTTSRRIRVEPKIGMIGVVLKSESKSCFCQNMGEFSIAEQPLEYFGRKVRSNTCFAICLQSSHTGDLLYVFEFFLYQSPATYECLMCFLNFLLPILKHELKSFKLGSGKQLGEQEWVIEVIEFSQPNQFTFPESEQHALPVKFQSFTYSEKECQHIEEQQVRSHPEIERVKRKHNLSCEDLKSHSDETLGKAAKDLGDCRYTFKRSCKEHGMERCSNLRKQARNSPLFERERSEGHQKDIKPSLQDESDDRKNSLIDVDDDDIVQNIDGIHTSQGPREKYIQKAKFYALLLEELQILCRYFSGLEKGRGITIVLDANVFSNIFKIYIHLEDLVPFCCWEPITGNCMVVYIWHLYNKMKDENAHRKFQFVNPFEISYVPNGKLEIRADALFKRFYSSAPNQILLAPCYVGKHWILTIIQPYEEIVMLLDPIAHYKYESWRNVVNMAINKLNDSLKKGEARPTWKCIKAPRQRDLEQCGYYVMRYMKDIVQGLQTIGLSSISSLFAKEEYTASEINEVRREWGLRVWEHIRNTIS